MSFEISNAIPGSSTNIYTNNTSNILGGGIQGFIAPAYITTNNNDEFAQTRYYLREAFNTSYLNQTSNQGIPARINTPFRLANNAGDKLSRKYYSCGGSSIQSSKPQQHGLRNLYGSIQSLCDNSGIEASNCNVKYVYDSSDYIKFKQMVASNKLYNILKNGGNDSQSQQVAFRAIRRY